MLTLFAFTLVTIGLHNHQSQNSQVDLLRPWEELVAEFPQLEAAEYSEHVLAPGEMMFIPRWHWHFIVAIDEATALRCRRERLGRSPSPHTDAAVPSDGVTLSGAASNMRDEVVAVPNKRATAARLPLSLPAPVGSTEVNASNPVEVQYMQESAANGPPLECAETSQVGKKKSASETHDEQQQDICVERGATVDYSFSVSFWWGARILQDYCK